MCQPQNWRKWAGYYVVGSYEHTIDREYWAIRNAAALIDVSPLMKYIIKGKDAAALLHKVTTRNIHKLKVGQVYYTGWCDDEGKMIDDGTVARLDETTFRLTAAEPNLRWLMMNAVGLDVRVHRSQTDERGGAQFAGTKFEVSFEACLLSRTVDGLKYFRLMKNKLDGVEVTISRTGYTGDLGYEIWMDAKDAIKVWDALMEAGHDYGITACGHSRAGYGTRGGGTVHARCGLHVGGARVDRSRRSRRRSSWDSIGRWRWISLVILSGGKRWSVEKREGSAWKMVGIEIDWVGMEKLYAEVGLPPQVPGTAMRASMPVLVGNVQVGYASTAIMVAAVEEVHRACTFAEAVL